LGQGVTAYLLLDTASDRLDAILDYTRHAWGEEQALKYGNGLFDKFEDIAARRIAWRSIPAEFEVRGFFCRYERHLIYWKILDDGTIGIAEILHERMEQSDALERAFGPDQL
jgi:toxin ParE1/3/4